MSFNQEDQAKVKKGVFITLLGKIAELSQGVYLYLARFLFGGDQFGLFIIGFNLIELISRFLVGGFGDAATFYSAKYTQDTKDEVKLYQSLSTLFIFPLLMSGVLVLGIHLSIDWIYDTWWTQHSSDLKPIIKVYSYILPVSVLVKIPLYAIRGHLEMKWPVIIENTALPLLHLIFSLLFWRLGLLKFGLVYASLIAYLMALPFCWFAFSKYFSIKKLFHHLTYSSEVIKFSIPQSLNMMMNYGLVKVDGIMLSAFLSANDVGIYTLLAELFRSIRSAKTSFSGVFAPLVAKYKSLNNTLGIQEALQQISSTTAKLSFPLLFVLMLFFPHLLSLDGGVWSESWWVPWLLALGPMLSCFFGLAGNTLLMMGYTKTLLANSVLLMLVNVGLNYLLIPPYGILGAALATAISGFGISLTQLCQLAYFEGIQFKLKAHLKTLLHNLPLWGSLICLQQSNIHEAFLPLTQSQVVVIKIALTILLLGPYAYWYLRQGLIKKGVVRKG